MYKEFCRKQLIKKNLRLIIKDLKTMSESILKKNEIDIKKDSPTV